MRNRGCQISKALVDELGPKFHQVGNFLVYFLGIKSLQPSDLKRVISERLLKMEAAQYLRPYYKSLAKTY